MNLWQADQICFVHKPIFVWHLCGNVCVSIGWAVGEQVCFCFALEWLVVYKRLHVSIVL